MMGVLMGERIMYSPRTAMLKEPCLKIKTEQVGFRIPDNLTFCNRDKRAYFIAVT